MKQSFLLAFLCTIYILNVSSQTVHSQYGHNVDVRDSIRIFVVFAQLDCGPCSGSGCIADNTTWLPDNLPPDAGEWFDHTLPTGQLPTKYLTKYYYEGSLGNYIVLGDYYPDIITVPCNYTGGWRGGTAVLDTLNAKTTPIITANGYTLDDFDLYSDELSEGILRTRSSNGVIDCIVIVWRNNAQHGCAGGWGVQNMFPSKSVQNKTALVAGNWGDCNGNDYFMFTAEYIHGLYGGNNWHTGSGAGPWTFLTEARSFSTTAQSASQSFTFCGWDREFLSWYHPNNSLNALAAMDQNYSYKASDLKIDTDPDSMIFILRDFITTGDAIRIKLPHLNWTGINDVKNQYLWIENHQRLSSYDRNNGCEKWSPGILSYIQVGKDIKSGTAGDVYPHQGADPAKPNTLGSWLFPLTAEGAHDIKFRTDLAQYCQWYDDCCWGNPHLPIDKDHPESKANPFTGMSDLFRTYDWNNDGILFKGKDANGNCIGDCYYPGLSEVINNNLVYNSHMWGDSSDAFTLSGNNRIGIYTNPAPVPVYTYRSNGYPGINSSGQPILGNWENRKIYLNGISIEIIDTFPNSTTGGHDIKVKIKWDDNEVKEDVRWAGDIILQNDVNDPLSRQSKIILAAGKKIHLDRGLSPTQHIAEGDGYFTKPTVLTLKSGTKTVLKTGSTLWIRDNSSIVIEDGAEFIVEDSACIVIDESAKLFMNHNQIVLEGNESTIVVRGTIETADNVDFSFEGNGFVQFYPTAQLVFGQESRFKFTGKGKTHRHFLFHPDTELLIDQVPVQVNFAKLIYDNNASLLIRRTNMRLSSITFEGINKTPYNLNTAVIASDIHDFHISTSDFNNFNIGVSISDIQSSTSQYPVRFLGTKFNNNYIGIKANGVHRQITGTGVYITGTNNISQDEIVGIEIENSGPVFLYEPRIQYNKYGIISRNNGTLEIANGYIKNNDIGVKADSTHLIINSNAEIGNNQIGIEFRGKAKNGNAIIVGNKGCGKIINNTFGVAGYNGTCAYNAILHIDAYAHACAWDSTCSGIVPNRFDGNTMVFKLNYELNKTADTSYPIIYGRYNYWGSDGSGNALPLDYSRYLVSELGCSSSKNRSNINDSFYVGQDAACVMQSYPNFGSVGDAVALNCSQCSNNLTSDTMKMSKKFYEAFQDFNKEEYYNAYSKFKKLSDEDIDNNLAFYSPGCINLVRISRALVDISIERDEYSYSYDTLASYSKKESSIEKIIPLSEIKNFLIPNPASSIVTINYNSTEATVECYDITGKKLINLQLDVNQEIHIDNWPKGIYIFVIRSNSGKIIGRDKLIVN